MAITIFQRKINKRGKKPLDRKITDFCSFIDYFPKNEI